MINTISTCKPFLKWTGSKQKLLPELMSRLPKDIGDRTYFELFLGGGSLFWELQPKKAFLKDANAELINCYRVVKNSVGALIDALNVYKENHSKGVLTDTYYNLIRAKYNACKTNSISSAAMFLYLNKTCFNGLYRVNGSGGFNVSMGDYKNPLICDEQRLRACSELLNDPYREISLDVGKYDYWGSNCLKESFFYLDPPYEPISKTSSFRGYGKDGFTANDQLKLKEYCDRLSLRGVKWMLSNSTAPLILDLYKEYNLEFVDTRRSISANAESRGIVQEVIVRNYQ
jgi:DNA adenine methylase